MEEENADGCLLVAPRYPGESKEDNEAARPAKSQKISCWTVEQLAKFVENIELRQFNATGLLNIVLNNFSPHDVTTKLEDIASQPSKNKSLYRAILKSLRGLEGRMTDEPRTVAMIRTEVSRQPEFEKIGTDDVGGCK